MQKLFVTYSDIHKLVAKASSDIEASGWEPDVIVAIDTQDQCPSLCHIIYKNAVNLLNHS